MAIEIDFSTALQQHTRSSWGLSQIGDCERKLTYIDHPEYEAEMFDAKTIRIFNFGHKIEELLCWEIQERGHKIAHQQAEITWGGRKGHIDGIIDTQYLWECKSHNSFAFKKLINNGLYQAYPQYHDQIQAYLNGTKLSQALFTGMNKDNSVIYQETIDYDPRESLRLWNKIQLLNWYADKQLIHPIPDWVSWHCKYCQYSKICKEDE